jgi:SAM-dependent methyltransferase
MSAQYDSSEALFRLLWEHYGMHDQISPVHPAAKRLCGTLDATVDEALRGLELPRRKRALDLGCGVGGSTFRLRNYFPHVVGVDRSAVLMDAARTMQRERSASATYRPEGFEPRTCYVRLPENCVVEGIDFREGDACDLPADLGVFDLVYMEKLLDRLPDPERCLRRLAGLIAPGGAFVHISPYWWRQEFTAPEYGLGPPEQSAARLDEILSPDFTHARRFKVPFLYQAHLTWFSYGLAEASIWSRR